MIGLPIQLHFDPWLDCQSEQARGLSKSLLQAILHCESHRQRKRSKAALAALEAILGAITANLLKGKALGGISTSIIVPLGKPIAQRSRYQRAAFTKLPYVIKVLSQAGLLNVTQGRRPALATTIAATGPLKLQLDNFQNSAGDLSSAVDRETLILSRTWWGYKAANLDPLFCKQSDRVDYTDNGRTRAIRKRLLTINQSLAQADMAFTSSTLAVDLSAITLRRHFTLPRDLTSAKGFTWNTGGRLFGGWWQNIPKGQRRFIRIDGEPIADLDYSALHIRLGCHQLGNSIAPECDPYALPSFERTAVKIALNSLVNSGGSRVTKDMQEALEGVSVAAFKEAIARHVPQVLPLLGSGLGLHLQFAESEILLAVLEQLGEKGIVALPMHDGLMVPESRAAIVKQVMQEVGFKQVGLELPVTVKVGEDYPHQYQPK